MLSHKRQGSAHAVAVARSNAYLRLQQGMRAHQAGDHVTAERLYRPLVHVKATRADALHYLGVLVHQQGHGGDPVALLEEAIALTPGHADAHNNLGNILKERGQLAEATTSYRRALALAPVHPHARGNLAVVLDAMEDHDAARSTYLLWWQDQPHDIRANYLYGRFLCTHPVGRDDIENAVTIFRHGLAVDPAHAPSLEALGMALYALDRIEEAASVYRQWSVRAPGHPIPQHMLAACGSAETPSRAGDSYIRHVFDRFAASFDEQLLGNLGYRAPDALLQSLDVAPATACLDVLDAGCGTGLCGPLVRSRARRLTGVDLSAAMIDHARRRGCYDDLHVAELTAFLAGHPVSYDLIVCADTLVYFGDLAGVFLAARQALRAGGALAFTLEAQAAGDRSHVLTPSGRYRHTAAHVGDALRGSGFTEVRIAADTLRREAGRWVDGWVVTARRAPDGES